ncbi:MAG: site-specific integrase [Desulfuromonadaceae bacterium]|nr:site-specific integrase [Desulfuromonadaceae bacterium]
MFLSKHITTRNGHYYYRMAIPNDLKHLFPFREIKQSLNTDNLKAAEGLALGIESKVQQAFAILRSEMISDEILPQIISSMLPRVTRQSSSRLKLSDLMQRYILQTEIHWTLKTKIEVKSECKLLIDLVGDKHIIAITRQMALEARDSLCKLPANLYKKYPNMTISQVLSTPDLAPMSVVSINKHIARLGSILRYGVREGHLFKNVAEALTLPIKRSIDEERSAYSDEDIKKVINILIDSSALFREERKWIPLIGIFSGMRLDEICQLYINDIQQIENIWSFNINDEKDKKLKNISSRRVVPIHSFLIEHGLLGHVQAMHRAGHERLWPCLTYSEKVGYSNTFGKWYQRFNRQHIAQDKRKVFHSFRHSFANNLKQRGIAESLIAELMGHKNHSITTGRYGKKYDVTLLCNAVNTINIQYNISGG